MSISLTLRRNIKRTDNGTVSLSIDAMALDMSPCIFAIEVMPASADVTAKQLRFSHVCSPSELSEFPEREPGDSTYFRIDSIEMVFDTDAYLDKVWNCIQKDASRLVRELKALQSADPQTDVVIIE